jgi:hypothetical protein
MTDDAPWGAAARHALDHQQRHAHGAGGARRIWRARSAYAFGGGFSANLAISYGQLDSGGHTLGHHLYPIPNLSTGVAIDCAFDHLLVV